MLILFVPFFVVFQFLAKDMNFGILFVKKEAIQWLLYGLLYVFVCLRLVAIYRQFSIAYKWPLIANNLNLTVFEDRERRKSKIPPIEYVKDNHFRIKSLGITKDQLKDNTESINRALGIHLNAIVDVKNKKGMIDPRYIDIYYSLTPLPSMVTFHDYPESFRKDILVFGKSEMGWIEFSHYNCRQIGIAGENGGGKTSFLLSLITQIVCNHSQHPIIIIDFKESYEFKSLLNLNHNIIYINNVDRAVQILYRLIDIHNERAEIISRKGHKDIYEVNKGDRLRLDHVWLIVDEADDLIPESNEAKTLISKLCQKGRSTGIHPILATQRLAAENMGGKIKEQLARQVSFKLNMPETSRLWMGDDSANKLPEQPGIAIVKRNGDAIIFQALYIDVETAVKFMKQAPLRLSGTYEKLLEIKAPAKVERIDIRNYSF